MRQMDRQTKSYTLTIFGQHIFPPLTINNTQWTKSNQFKFTWVKNTFQLFIQFIIYLISIYSNIV